MNILDTIETEQHFKLTLFFPLRDNEGEAFEEVIWASWRNELTKLLSGFTDLGVVNGWWQGQSDQNQWIVAVITGTEQLDALRGFLQWARQVFRQDAMYFEWHPVHFELVT
jgi:hypothetical protein